MAVFPHSWLKLLLSGDGLMAPPSGEAVCDGLTSKIEKAVAGIFTGFVV